MNANRIRSSLLSAACWFWVTVAVTVLAIFWEPLVSGLPIWGPDSNSFAWIQTTNYRLATYLGWWQNLYGLGAGYSGQTMIPSHLLAFLLPGQLIKVGVYIGAVLGTILAAIYWFRGRGIMGWPAYLGALALGITAHTFSLIAAGHDGKIQSWPFCILMLASVDRAMSYRHGVTLTRRSMFCFALAGYAAGIPFSVQADMAMLFSFLIFAYGLYLFIRLWPRKPDAPLLEPAPALSGCESGELRLRKLRIQHVVRNVIGALLATAILCGVSLPALTRTLKISLPNRDREIQASVSGATGDAKKNRWEFATNWSLPPEEILEFVAPCVFGIQTGDPKGPYWGRLGRTLGWEQHHRGLMNLRQHTVYLGVIQLVFAAFAVVWAIRRRNAECGMRNAERGKEEIEIRDPPTRGRSASGGKSEIRNRRADIFFWTGVFVISILLALGRNFPLYRLFYMIPYAGELRAPVKFLHLAEVSLCCLFAFGLDAFLAGIATRQTAAIKPQQDRSKKSRDRSASVGLPLAPQRGWRFFGFACAGIGGIFLLSLAVVSASENSLAETWRSLGMGSYSGVLMSLMTGALARAAVLFLVCAGAFLVAAYGSSPSIPRVLPVVLLVVLALDMGSVMKRYIKVWDEYDRFTPSELIARIGNDKSNYRVALPARGGLYDIWKRYIFPRDLITVLDSEDSSTLSAEDKRFYEKLSRAPLRLWQITSTPNIIGPTAALAPLTNAASVEVVAFFNFTREGTVQWTSPSQGQQVWLRLRNVLPRAAVYQADHVDGDSWADRLVDPTWNPAQTVIVAGASTRRGGGQGGCEPAEVVSYKSGRVEIAARSRAGGILMLNDRFDPEWKVFVDGKEAPLLRCNGVMRGVAVPAGEHRVVFLYRPDWGYFTANMAGTLILLIWGAARLLTQTAKRFSSSSLAEHAT